MMKNKEWTNRYIPIFLVCIILAAHTSLEAKIFNKLTSPTHNGAMGTGWIDLNGDNKIDAFQSSFCYVYLNKGNNVFELINNSEITPVGEGNGFSGFCWGDYDNNGFADLFISNMSTGANDLYKNLGNGHFEKVTSTVISKDRSSSLDGNWIDYDNDGFLDLLVTASGTGFYPGTGNLNLLYKNNGNGTFTKIENNGFAEQRTLSDCAAFADMDNDGDQDLFMTEWINSNWLFENNGDATFKRITNSIVNTNGNTSITASWGDYDNDGFLDLFVGNGSTSNTVKQRNYLFHNNGNKSFSRAVQSDITTYSGCLWTSAWGDVDNDGDLDLYAGTIYEKEEVLFINNGDGTFTNAHEFEMNNSAKGTSITGASFGDYDNDGALDLIVADVSGTEAQFIYHNAGNNNNWINVSCSGIVSNRSAIGARVKIKATVFGKSFWQIREIHTKQGFRGSNDLRAHFGLGDATVIDSLIINWPSGIQNIMTNIPVNQCLEITESIPDDFFKAQFIADNISTYSPKQIHFTNLSICGANYNNVIWSWDFNGDGIEDSNEKDPVFTFDCYDGKEYSVSLTITSGNTTQTLIKQNYIKLLPAKDENISLNKNVSVSSCINESKHPGAHAVDGEAGTYWQSISNPDSQWIKIEFERDYNIARIKIEWGTLYAKKYNVQVSRDGISWLELKSIEGGDGRTDDLEIDAILAKYLKLNFIQSSSATQGYRITELEIYQPDTFTGVDEQSFSPVGFVLYQNYPNPFNPTTNLEFRIPQKGMGSSGSELTSLKIYDILGNEVATLLNEEKPAGEYKIQFDGSNLCSGIYFYQLKCGLNVETKKMLFLK